MREYIVECQTRSERYKAAYAESPDFQFMYKATLGQRVLDELEAGLHEVIGSPQGSAITPLD